MSGPHDLTRSAILHAYFEDAFDYKDQVEVTVTSTEEHARIVKGRTSFYYDRGIVPLSPDIEDRILRGAVCAPIILAETAGWDEQPFLAYLVYWGLRLKIRVNQQVELGSLGDSMAPEDIVEEMVESEMVAAGLPRWWEAHLN